MQSPGEGWWPADLVGTVPSPRTHLEALLYSHQRLRTPSLGPLAARGARRVTRRCFLPDSLVLSTPPSHEAWWAKRSTWGHHCPG